MPSSTRASAAYSCASVLLPEGRFDVVLEGI